MDQQGGMDYLGDCTALGSHSKRLTGPTVDNSYRIEKDILAASDQGFESALARAYAEKTRPACLCNSRGVPMYIAKVACKYIIKRMPGTGVQHAPDCDSFEPPPELSGLGQVFGTAIQENAEDGLTALKFDFSLKKLGRRVEPGTGGGEADSVKTDGNKLTLRATLHFLWERSGFNRWTPAMEGKRSWLTVRKYLLDAAASMVAKKSNLADLIYIPETFRSENKDEISQRRVAQMAKICASSPATTQLMLVVAEVKELKRHAAGYKLWFKHVPDCGFNVNADLEKRLQKRFANEIALRGEFENSHLIAVATVSMSTTGLPFIEEIALMLTNHNWVPFENLHEKMLLDALHNTARRFTKGLRYNLASSAPLASAVLTDTDPLPTGLYITPVGASDEAVAEMLGLSEESEIAAWTWNPMEGVMPSLPQAR